MAPYPSPMGHSCTKPTNPNNGGGGARAARRIQMPPPPACRGVSVQDPVLNSCKILARRERPFKKPALCADPYQKLRDLTALAAQYLIFADC